MIALLTGRLKRKAPDYLILDVSGVGYHVFVPLSTYAVLPDDDAEIALHIHTHFREDSLSLYGFVTEQEKMLFHLLIGISGIGPKIALSVLSSMQVPELVRAIQTSDDSKICAVPGIGKKTAARMVLELKDKIAALAPAGTSTDHQAALPRLDDDAVSALVNLGYKQQPAQDAVARVLRTKPGLPLKEIVREALAALTRR